MKKRFLRALCLILTVLLCTSCSSGKGTRPSLNTDFVKKENPFSFSETSPLPVAFSEEAALSLKQAVSAVEADYPYEELYELEEVKKRLNFSVSVEQHKFSALNAAGALDSAHFADLVKKNSDAFLGTKPFGYEKVPEETIDELCAFIVKVAEEMRARYPDLDWERIYCNLGNLKIAYDKGSLNFAQVSPEMVLGINENNTSIVLTLKGEDGFSRVLTHETMHILQMGCSCEDLGTGSRRAGICVYWDDFTLNTADWTWMVEGAAERNMCKLTGGDAVTYQYKMDYLCSLTLSVLLRPEVQADTLDLLCFYEDPELFFTAFGAVDEAEREELIKMMVTLQILQIQPNAFHAMYKEKTGVDLKADEDAMNRFSYSLKPGICTTLAKEFYFNLASFLQENSLSRGDLFCLLALFEGHLNQHLNFADESKREINKPFFDAYEGMRSALFDLLEKENGGADFHALYAAYDLTEGGAETLNATLSSLPEEKREFLLERAAWQAGLNALEKKYVKP